jgi:hypothetical protein
MKLKKLKLKIARKISNFFIFLAGIFVKPEPIKTTSYEPDSKDWFEKTFGVDVTPITAIIDLCENTPFKTGKKMSQETYNKLLEEERKESIKLYQLLKRRLISHFDPEVVERHNDFIQTMASNLTLKELIKREEKEGEFLLKKQEKTIVSKRGSLVN